MPNKPVLITFGVTIAALAVLYQTVIAPVSTFLGRSGGGRPIDYVNVDKCHSDPVLGLQACDKMVLHEPSGLLYLACSSPDTRAQWAPVLNHLNATGLKHTDYVAIYDPAVGKAAHMKISGFNDPRGLSLHGMDVVPSAEDPNTLFVYLINHRVPDAPFNAKDVGANSSVEIFKTTVRGSTLTHLYTVEHHMMVTPNDVLGSPDGKSFWSINDHGDTKTGMFRNSGWPHILNWPWSQAYYCHVDEGCKLALAGLKYPNGLARGKDGRIWVSESVSNELFITEAQPSNTLRIVDVVYVDRPIDNLSIDADGNLWAAGYPNYWAFMGKTKQNPLKAPSSVLRITPNASWDQVNVLEKWSIEKMFDDDGKVASATTIAVYDSERKQLYLHGLLSPYLTICKL